ncbi:MAG: YciI family protein [Streptosporangiaceae bacterium]
MAQYLLSVHYVAGEVPPAPEVMEKMYADVSSVNAELQSAGAWVFAGGLEPPADATVVTVGDGGKLIANGPFAQGKEHLAGFWVIEAADRDAALDWAARASAACLGPVEVRPFQPGP